MVSATLQTLKKAFSLFTLTLLLFTSFLILNQNAEAQPELFVNGSFETGDFTGWDVALEPGSSGDWFIYSGNLSPLTNSTILPPPDGMFAATTD